MKNLKNQDRKKMPVSLILITIWMFLAVLGLISKLISMDRLALNRQLFGDTLAIINHGIGWAILFAFIGFIIAFLWRANARLPFICFILFLLVGDTLGITYSLLSIDRVIAVLNGAFDFPAKFPTSLLIFGLVASFLFHLGFYLLVIYFVQKNKSFFENG